MTITEYVQDRLLSLKEDGFDASISRRVPQVDKETIIGIRTPKIRKFAEELAAEAELSFDRTEELREYLTNLPHQYFEENMLHMMLIGKIKNQRMCIWYMEIFLPYVDNLMVCDLPAPQCFVDDPWNLFPCARRWSWDPKPYTCRYGINLLRQLYMDRWFFDRELDSVARTESNVDFVNAAAADYMVTALQKHWKLAIQVLEDRRLTPEIHKLTLKKVSASKAFSAEKKEYIKSLVWDYYRPFPHWYQIDPVVPHKEWWWTDLSKVQ